MSAASDALEDLRSSLASVQGLHVSNDMATPQTLPAALVDIPSLTWESFCADPVEAMFTVVLVVPQTARASDDLLVWLPTVTDAIDDLRNTSVRSARPGNYNNLPAYFITVGVTL
jgi:hypothetical protein